MVGFIVKEYETRAMHACDPSGIGFTEPFTVELTALDFLRLAVQAFKAKQSAQAQTLLAMSYHARAQEDEQC